MAACDMRIGARLGGALLLFSSLGTLHAEAQQQGAQRAQSLGIEDRPASKPAARCLIFQDTFAFGVVDDRRWQQAVGVTTFADARGAHLGVEAGAARHAELRSQAIDVRDYTDVTLSIGATPAPGASTMQVEYAVGDRGWQTIAATVPHTSSESSEFPLPVDSAAGPLRIRLTAEPASGGWWIHEVSVRGAARGPARRVTLDTRAASGDERFIAGDPDQPASRLELSAPAELLRHAEQELTFVAPPEMNGATFARWTIDGIPQARRSRVVRLGADGDHALIAEYERDGKAVRVSLGAVPDGAAQPALGPAEDDSLASVRRSSACVRGERVAIFAPQRTPRHVFSHWLVDGRRVDRTPPLVLTAEADVDVRAVYARLGDLNDDGRVDVLDVELFCLALAKPEQFDEAWPGVDRQVRGDLNGDGHLDESDIEVFVEFALGR